jgi:3-hydroxybutyryl-CoA dehydrogenase
MNQPRPNPPLTSLTVAVVGAGTMGAGIAQIAAQAGHPVRLHDAREGAASAAKDGLARTFEGLVAKGKLTGEAAQAALERITPAAGLDDLADAGLVVEAVVEHLDVKRKLFAELESRLGAQAILASNTSSLSITAIARDLQRPERLVGMHFFNPVPLMKLVEVVSGLRTDPAVAATVFALATAWGKVPVHARSTPGFIVNRIARPYYAEALALLQQGAAEPAQLDTLLRAAGFRMGPCELMDLIGHDVNFAVTESVFGANFGDKRYAPSLLQRELVDGGLLGRKSGRGFYVHPGEAATSGPGEPAASAVLGGRAATVHGRGALAERLAQTLEGAGLAVAHRADDAAVGVQLASGELWLTDGRSAQQRAAEAGRRHLAVLDWPVGEALPGALAYAVAASASEAFATEVASLLGAAGLRPQRVADVPGLVVARTVAMLINEAADAVQQGVCEPAAADTAMKLGVNYPAGPFEWLARLGPAPVVALLEALDAQLKGERYRVSPWLAQQAWQSQLPG